MSPRRIAKILGAIGATALAALVIATVYIVNTRSRAASMRIAADLVPGSLAHARNFRWTQMKGGQQQWILNASEASYSEDKTTIVLKQPHLTMTAEDGKPVSVEGSKAILNIDGDNHVKRAELSGGATIHYGDFVIDAEDAVFRPDDDQVEAPGAVTIEGEGLKVSGIGLVGHPKLKQFELQKQVTTHLVPNSRIASAKKE